MQKAPKNQVKKSKKCFFFKESEDEREEEQHNNEKNVTHSTNKEILRALVIIKRFFVSLF